MDYTMKKLTLLLLCLLATRPLAASPRNANPTVVLGKLSYKGLKNIIVIDDSRLHSESEIEITTPDTGGSTLIELLSDEAIEPVLCAYIAITDKKSGVTRKVPLCTIEEASSGNTVHFDIMLKQKEQDGPIDVSIINIHITESPNTY
jgi:hypothetical protein